MLDAWQVTGGEKAAFTTRQCSCISFFRPAGRKNDMQKNSKYHAAVRPEPVEGQAITASASVLRKRINNIIAHRTSRQPYLLTFLRQQAIARQPIHERAQPWYIVVGKAILDLETQRQQRQRLAWSKLSQRLN